MRSKETFLMIINVGNAEKNKKIIIRKKIWYPNNIIRDYSVSIYYMK